MNRRIRFGVIASAWLAATASAPGGVFGSTFTYQGWLNENSQPANGQYDMTFRLCNVGTCNGGGVLQSIAVSNVNVADGGFTVALSFDLSHFTGDRRWLEIAVEGTTLCPRQELTATPHAIFSLKPWETSGNDVSYTRGNVGIGRSDPQFKLHTVGDTAAEGSVYSLSPDLQSAAFLGWGTDENGDPMARIRIGGNGVGASNGLEIQRVGDRHLMRILNNGRVGIGADPPLDKLHVVGNVLSEGGSLRSTNPNNSAAEVFLGWGTDAYGDDVARIRIGGDGSGAKNGLAVQTIGDREIMRIQHNGMVGINDSTLEAFLNVYSRENVPCAEIHHGDWDSTVPAVHIVNIGNGPALHVEGKYAPVAAVVEGVCQVSVLEVLGADVAERFAASEELRPGMVVAIDPNNPGKLCLARGAYNHCVAGVVSGANGLSAGTVLGNLPESKDGPPVALTGRVWVVADASSAAIEPGDLLTTAETPGHAMKAVDRDRAPGATLGKAMTGLKQGETGLILVLVNLQ